MVKVNLDVGPSNFASDLYISLHETSPATSSPRLPVAAELECGSTGTSSSDVATVVCSEMVSGRYLLLQKGSGLTDVLTLRYLQVFITRLTNKGLN